jgi:serine protease Do
MKLIQTNEHKNRNVTGPLAIIMAVMFAAFSQPAFAKTQAKSLTKKPHPAVVRIRASEGDAASFGSGTLVGIGSKHGIVVTNWHVVRDATGPISVIFPDGNKYPATVIETDKTWDLAALLIWRPKTAPVTISNKAPVRGDALTIAGYGSGKYRQISGKATQFVSPGEDHPYEMVEVNVAARSGDSGGPILNNKGQLAGVLFGSADGSTNGSHCGRVRWFLRRVLATCKLPKIRKALFPGHKF